MCGKGAGKPSQPQPGPSEASEPDVDIRVDFSVPVVAEVVAEISPGDVAGSGEVEFTKTMKWLRALREGVNDAQAMASKQPHVAARSAVMKVLSGAGMEDNASLCTILGTVAATTSSITQKNRAHKIDGLAMAIASAYAVTVTCHRLDQEHESDEAEVDYTGSAAKRHLSSISTFMVLAYNRLSQQNINAARVGREIASYEQAIQGLAACLAASQDDTDPEAQVHALAVVTESLHAAETAAQQAMKKFAEDQDSAEREKQHTAQEETRKKDQEEQAKGNHIFPHEHQARRRYLGVFGCKKTLQGYRLRPQLLNQEKHVQVMQTVVDGEKLHSVSSFEGCVGEERKIHDLDHLEFHERYRVYKRLEKRRS